jgi:integrase
MLYYAVVLALSTGARKGELRRLEWANVDLDKGIVRFVQTKTHLDRSVPVIGEGLLLLRDLAVKRQGARYVFPRGTGQRSSMMYRSWITARRRASLGTFRFHDLRHTFASYMAMSGATLRDIAECLGHTKIQQTMCYAHLLQSHTTSVVERMVRQFLKPGPTSTDKEHDG